MSRDFQERLEQDDEDMRPYLEKRKSLGAKECVEETIFMTKKFSAFSKGMDGFSINLSKIFFWNETSIWYFTLADPAARMTDIGLFVSPKER